MPTTPYSEAFNPPNFANRTFWTGDNLPILQQINSTCVDLIYLDPPFNTNRRHQAIAGSQAEGMHFDDHWSPQPGDKQALLHYEASFPQLKNTIDLASALGNEKDRAYLTYITLRLVELHRILKPTGSLYLHCDLTMSHALKWVMDAIFGKSQFRNEIIWRRDFGGKGAKKNSGQYPRNHDVIFFYSKSNQWHFAQPYCALTEKQQQAYRHVETHSKRRYKAVQLGDYSARSIEQMKQDGLIHVSSSGKQYKKYYLDEAKSVIDCIWTDLPGFGTRTAAKEYIGYPTQKPLPLLKRIIETSSKVGDMVLDPFCGAGTTCVAAEWLDRKWVAIDLNHRSFHLAQTRLYGKITPAHDMRADSSVPEPLPAASLSAPCLKPSLVPPLASPSPAASTNESLPCASLPCTQSPMTHCTHPPIWQS